MGESNSSVVSWRTRVAYKWTVAVAVQNSEPRPAPCPLGVCNTRQDDATRTLREVSVASSIPPAKYAREEMVRCMSTV
eukprot:7014097-Pyramimonas_sp.AAC.1